MNQDIDLNSIHDRIRTIESTARELEKFGRDFPAVQKNVTRLLACVKMLELNVCDLIDLPETSVGG